jgi:branched-chain amino acid transport system substrate-binding protein
VRTRKTIALNRFIRDGFALATTTLGLAAGPVAAQPAEVKVALITPLSGAWARSGDLARKGAELAIADINAAGGIKALGGARMKLVVGDTGSSPETAKSAAQRLLSSEPDLVGGSGSEISSFTLAVTEVTERAELPWLTLAYSDLLTSRGFRYVFQTSPTADEQAAAAMPAILNLAVAATGKKPAKLAIVMDNTPSPASFSKAMRGPALAKYGLTLTADETYTPPLSDATPLAQKVRAGRPDFLLFLPTVASDIKLVLEKLNEVGLPRTRLPVVSNGAPVGSPDLLKIAGKDAMEGVMFITANWGFKGLEPFIARFRQATGEPYLTQDSISNYGHMWLLKAAMEDCACADRRKVAETLHRIEITGEAAQFFPGRRVRFDEKGRIVGAPLLIAQWQGGEPKVVYPEENAFAKPVWSKQ